ncbi:hypothetical protein Zmor_012446 [Zophobas morio]|uniref:Tc1-like transposase DDE domain-containing protein n=1 Tax=Zophobas morio TaxID=2755281 RepID=A0AA38MEA0_9CUCU|nr:hypothetical protein Zmor_012446 [Zophobas morio]
MIALLRQNTIPHNPQDIESELYNFVKLYKTKTPDYRFDKILKGHGHDILRLPPYSPEFNPSENIYVDHSPDDEDDIFMKVCDAYEARVEAEKRRGKEARYLPREKNNLLASTQFQLSPSGRGTSVAVGLKMPTGDVVCRIYNQAETAFCEFDQREFVEFSNKMMKMVPQIRNPVSGRHV